MRVSEIINYKLMSVTEERLREKLQEGAFYDYNQLLKTLFFKLKMRKREQEY